jgi:hypothetical protein
MSSANEWLGKFAHSKLSHSYIDATPSDRDVEHELLWVNGIDVEFYLPKAVVGCAPDCHDVGRFFRDGAARFYQRG